IDTPEEVIGLMVADKNTTLKREIFDISGTLKEHRERLLRITQTEVTVNLIENSPDDTLVVVLGREHYEYAATCLWPIVRSDDYKLFGVDAQKVNRHLRMHPKDRYELVGKISRLIRMQNLTGFEYSTNTHNNLFLTPRNIGFDKKVRLGNDVVVTYGKDIFYQLKKSGLYQYSKEFEEGSPIRIGVVKSQSIRNPKSLYKDLETELSDMKLDMGIVAEETLSEDSRIELEYCIDRLERHEPHLVLGVFDWGPSYHSFKLLTVGRGLASQVVLQKTLANKYAIPNIVLGIVGKTGNIPYVLEKPLPFADMIVGIDVAREKKRKLKGTVNVAAIARIYFSNGQFVKYVIHDEPIEGETIPVSVLQSLFPANEFKGRKVILHRDGSFRGDEENALKEWANNIDATIYPVEVIKSGAPRLYGAEEISPSPQGVDRPQVGMSFLVSSTEALLASSPPHDRNATPRPLRIRTKSSLSIRDALQSVMSLTILHCGSTIPPRLPVTVHYSDKIAGLALKGVKPKNLEGDRPYWY
ncbi:MAG: Piwi domain-containing protein, partial [Candidatus Thorarchaeota archaeon]